MASFNYNKTAETARRLIVKFGQQVTLTRKTNTVTGSDGSVTQTTTTEPLDLVTVPASKGTVEAFDDRLKQDLVKGKIRFAIVAAKTASFRPLADDLIPLDGSTFRVLGMTPLSPAGVDVIYKIGMTQV